MKRQFNLSTLCIGLITLLAALSEPSYANGVLKIEYVCTPILDGAPGLSPDHCSIRFYTDENPWGSWCRGGPGLPGRYGGENMGNPAGCAKNGNPEGPAVGECGSDLLYFEHHYRPFYPFRDPKPGTTTYPIQTDNPEAAQDCITRMMKEFTNRCYTYSHVPYKPPAANSNSFAANALRCCGLTPPNPKWAPGHDVILPCYISTD
jgi:hypothetical protein